MPTLKKVISAHLLPRQQLLALACTRDWSADKVPEDMAVLDAWPCCHVIDVFVVVAGQIRVVRHRKANIQQLFQVSSLRVSIYRSDVSCFLYGSRRTRSHSCQPKGVTRSLLCTRPRVQASALPVSMRCEFAPKSCITKKLRISNRGGGNNFKLGVGELNYLKLLTGKLKLSTE